MRRVDIIATDQVDIEEGGYVSDGVINGKLVIVVTDTGAGISDENQRRLFNEIVQFTPEVLQAGGGSGLGLWITNSLVKMHNGSVRVHSAGEGMGCSFTAEIEMQRKSALMDLHAHRRPVSRNFPSLITDSFESPGLMRTSDERDVLDSESKVDDSKIGRAHV